MASAPKRLSQKFKKFLSAIKSLPWRNAFGKKPIYRRPGVFRPEEYLPGPVWDALDPGERYASVGDLCAHIGDQMPVQAVKLIARDVLRGLESFHETHEIAHGDIDSNNILLAPKDMKALLYQLSTDTQASLRPSRMSYETVFLDINKLLVSRDPASLVFKLSSSDSDRIGRDCFTEKYALRAPEAILGAPCGTSMDMWSLGCVIYEMLTGETLFDPFFQTVELGLTPEESHLIQIIELLGAFPEDVIHTGEYSDRWFNEAGVLRLDTTYYPVDLETILRVRLDEAEVADATAFLSAILRIRPEDRAKAKDLVDHPWFSC